MAAPRATGKRLWEMTDKTDDVQVQITAAVEVGITSATNASGSAKMIRQDTFGGHSTQEVTTNVAMHGRHDVVV